MKLKNKIIHVLVCLVILPVAVYAQDPFAKLPSEQTKSQIQEMAAAPSAQIPTRDWWSGSGNGEGPPTSGGGGGGAVGMAITEGTLPVILAGALYFSFLIIRRKRRIRKVF